MIEIKNLSKGFDGRTVLQKVTLDIPRGAFTGLYGRSGCGKSTLAKILCGALSPDEGEIFLDGKQLFLNRKYDRETGKRIQLVRQQPFSALDPVQKIGDGLTELARYNKLAKTKAERRALVEKAADDMLLNRQTLNSLPCAISGGEAQRVSIAKCLMLNAEYVILDEATSMLDVSTQANVFALIKDLVKNRGLGVIAISHDLDLINLLCEKIYFYENFTFKEMQK